MIPTPVFVSSRKKHSKYGSLLKFSKKKKETGSLPVGGFAPQAAAEKPLTKRKTSRKKVFRGWNLVSRFFFSFSFFKNLMFCHEKRNRVSNKIKNVHYHSNFALCVLFLREKETRDFECFHFSYLLLCKIVF